MASTLLVATLMTTACQKEKDETFTATAQSYTASKLHIANVCFAYWDNSDNVMINGSSYGIAIDGANNNTAKINASDVRTYGGTYYAIFPASRASMGGSSASFDLPYSESYSTNASGYQLTNNIMAAKSTTTHLEFANIGAMLHFSISGSGSGIGKELLAIEVSADVPLSGTLSVDMSASPFAVTLSGTDADTARRLTFDTPYTLTADAKDFYLNLPEASGIHRFRVRYLFNNGGLKAYEKTKEDPSGNITFNRSVIYHFGNDVYSGEGVTFNGSSGSSVALGSTGNPLRITSDRLFSAAAPLLKSGKAVTLDKDISVAIRIDTLTGILDGNGHTITLSGNSLSLSRTVNGGTVKNLTVAGNITSPECYNYTFGAVACSTANGAVIDNCVNKTNITCTQGKQNSNTYVGGIVGYANGGSITNCRNEGTITSDSRYVGGVAGCCSSALTASGCGNTKAITVTIAADESRDVFIGGVFGYISLSSSSGTHKVQQCSNSGSITISGTTSQTIYCGGCFGTVFSAAAYEVDNCANASTATITYNTAAVNACYIGGIAGSDINSTTSSTMSNCCNEAAITASTRTMAGGLLGYNQRMSVQNCYAYCDITAATASGIVGTGVNLMTSTNINNCYYYGNLSGTHAYGIAGDSYNSSTRMNISYCHYPGSIASICGVNSHTGDGCSTIADVNGDDLLDSLTTHKPSGANSWRKGSTHIVFN